MCRMICMRLCIELVSIKNKKRHRIDSVQHDAILIFLPASSTRDFILHFYFNALYRPSKHMVCTKYKPICLL